MTGLLTLGGLSVGTAPLGGMYAPVTDNDAYATLAHAADGGVTHFDTAPHYGRGLAESRLGTFLERYDRTGSCTVSTKVGRRVRTTAERATDDIFLGAPPGESTFDFSPQAIHDDLDESRERIGRDYIDIVFIHDPDDHLDEVLAAAEALGAERESGGVGAIGVGTNSAVVVHHLLDRVELDAVLLAGRITLLEDSGDAVAERCANEGIVLLAAGVFQSGILAGGNQESYDYGAAPDYIRDQVAELGAICARHGVSLHEVAINHPRRFRGVTSTLVGVRSPDEADAALSAFDQNLPNDLWADIDTARARWADGERAVE